MPEAQLTEPLDHAAEKGGVKETFAALEASRGLCAVERAAATVRPVSRREKNSPEVAREHPDRQEESGSAGR